MKRAAAILLLALAHVAHAGPTIAVRAHTRLVIDRVTRTYDGATVSGRLLETGAGNGGSAGVRGETVFLSIEDDQQAVHTGDGGRFTASFPMNRGTYEIDASFQGNEQYDASSIEHYPFTIGKSSLQVSVHAPGEVDSRATAIELVVSASNDGAPQRVALSLSLGDLGMLAPLQVVATGDDGKATVKLERGQLGPPGEKRVKVSFPGDSVFNPASDETTFLLVTTTAFRDVEMTSGTIKNEGTILARGRLVDADDAPVRGARISLMAGGKLATTASTDKEGRFKISRRAADFAPGQVSLAVEYISTTSWRRGARTPPVSILILEPRPVPVGYTILAFSATAAALLGFILARTRPWAPFVARWRARRKKPESTLVDRDPAGARAGAQAGLKVAHAPFMSTLRRPQDHGVSGSVADVVTGAAVASAHVLFVHESHTTREVGCDPAGHFDSGELPAATWRVEVSAKGYVTERFSMTIPHRGELRGVRVDLLPVRERLFAIYRDVAQPLLPKADAWGVWTPREIFDHVRARRPAGALGALTDFVEEAYFSQRIPDETILPDAAARAKAAAGELLN